MNSIHQYTRSDPRPRFLYLGMAGVFSYIPLEVLLEHGYRPAAIVTPPPPGMSVAFRALDPAALSGEDQGESIYRIAAREALPVYEIGDLNDVRCRPLLADLDYIITACFPRLLPSRWLDAPRSGCLNLHPSLLPAYRGPTPLEDQLAAGERATGITLHLMDETADTGDILLQEAYPVPEGAAASDLDRAAAQRGAQLLVRYLGSPQDFPPRPQ